MQNSKEKLLYFLTIFFASVILFASHLLVANKVNLFQKNSDFEEIICKVTEVKEEIQEISSMGDMYYLERKIKFSAEIIKGERKGELVEAVQIIDNVYSVGTLPIEKGDQLFLYSAEENGKTFWYAGEYYRSGKIGVFGIFFCLAVILFGKKKGFNTILSLFFTCAAIFLVFVPSILAGQNPYIFSCLICIYTIVVTLALVDGYSKKSLAAALGCVGGILAAGLATVLMGSFMKMTGFLDDDSLYVYLMNPDKPIDLKAIIFSANIIGALGATMDVAMSISSSLFELKEKAPDLSFKEICLSGIKIGQDIMGTMANTLVLAYIGSSLSTVLLFVSYQSSLLQLLNREIIIAELLQALSGSVGILLTIPISTFASAAAGTFHKKDALKDTN